MENNERGDQQQQQGEGDGEGKERRLPCCCCCLVLELPLGECAATFKLENAVCNHGLFMMAPNLWIPSTNTLQRPLRLLDDANSLTVSISHDPRPNHTTSLLVQVHGTNHLSSANQQAILGQVARMLRISGKDEEDVQEFHKVHPEAKKRGFGRLFRSPTLFEDAVKAILLCNCTWMRTLKMAQALCELQLELTNGGLVSLPLDQDSEESNMNITSRRSTERKGVGVEVVKRKRSNHEISSSCSSSSSSSSTTTATTTTTTDHDDQAALNSFGSNAPYCLGIVGNNYKQQPQSLLGNFPTAKELASLNLEVLEKRCNLGYRARRILNLARSVENNELRLSNEFEDNQVSDDDNTAAAAAASKLVYSKLMKVKGFGPFACANVLMCIGFYERVPEDSETIRHLSEYHARKNCNKRTTGTIIKEIYGKYAPFQCLAYWLELVEYYESKLGTRLSKLPSSSYGIVTGSMT